MKSLLFALIVLLAAASRALAAPLEFKPGDHICLIGNALAERMQHHSWLETLLHGQFPRHELVFRNLGYAGDEVNGWQDGNRRLRSMSFGSQDEWLSASSPCPQPNKLQNQQDLDENRFALVGTKPDVIFAFFGYNESFAGTAGLDGFKQNLTAFIRHTSEQKYNGKGAPRLVLFSPTAMEFVGDANLPGKDQVASTNARLKAYAGAMKEVAAAQGVKFVDLFTPTAAIGTAPPSDASRPVTINGVHLNEKGDELVAAIAFDQLVEGARAANKSLESLEPLRQAVNDKNWHWFQRYRTTDGYSTYGDRAFLSFVDQQTNYVVLQRELKILDVMTANRDQVVWAVAQGQQKSADDGNTPPYIPVKTNKPGAGPDGTHIYLSGSEEMSHFKLGAGLQAQLFASETEFPELINPVQMAWDTKGRLWVAAWPTYPHWIPKQPMNDKLLILEDTNGDGRADVCKTFAGDLHNPTGFEFWNGGVIVAQGPQIKFLKDTDGDDRYDVSETWITGVDTADTHHTINSFTFDPGGALYMQEGTFHHSQIETPWGPPVRLANAGAFRYEPRSQKFDVYTSYGFANPHGHVFDRWGQDFLTDGTGAQTYYGTAFSGQMDYPHKHGGMQTVYNQRERPCPATEILSSRHFPDDWQGDLLVGNVIGFQGILRYKLEDRDSGFGATEKEPFVSSDDPNFRPSDLEMGPDGALYFTDWQNAIIGHMQHNLRDPSRDHLHGRIYRVTYEGRELSRPTPIAGEPIGKLLDLLKSPEDRVRYRTRIELSGRPTADVIAAVGRWVAALDKNDPNYQHNRMEALWVHQHHNVVNENLLVEMLASPEPKARAAATRVLCYWRDRVREPLELLRGQVNDENPRVRLEAVRALSFFDNLAALEVATESLIHPQDDYLKYTLQETMNTLDRRLKAANK